MKFSSINLVLLAVAGAFSLSAAAATRTAETYSCSVFNSVTGYARILHRRSDKQLQTARLLYGLTETQLDGGGLSYETLSNDLPHTVFYSTGKNAAPIHMSLARPLEHTSKKAILVGWTYISTVATSVVTCRVSFEQ